LRVFVWIALFLCILARASWSQDTYNQTNWGQGPQQYSWAAGTVNKFGFNGDIDTTEESIWDMDDLPTAGAGPIRCFDNMLSAAALYISSDSDSDVGKTVSVQGLDLNWESFDIDVVLGSDAGTGTTNVQIGTVNIWRINRAFTVSAELVGNIYIHKDATDATGNGIPDTPATDIVAGITLGANQTLQSCYTVPLGYNAYITNICLANINQVGVGSSVTFRARRSAGGAAHVHRSQLRFSLGNETSICMPYDPPLVYPEKTDFEITGSDASNQATAATFDLFLMKN